MLQYGAGPVIHSPVALALVGERVVAVVVAAVTVVTPSHLQEPLGSAVAGQDEAQDEEGSHPGQEQSGRVEVQGRVGGVDLDPLGLVMAACRWDRHRLSLIWGVAADEGSGLGHAERFHVGAIDVVVLLTGMIDVEWGFRNFQNRVR